MSNQARQTQSHIYIHGLSGKKPSIPFHFEELERLAQNQLSAEAFAYVAGGAGREDTELRNREAFRQYHILPKMLDGKVEADLSIELFGDTYQHPFFLAPIGVLDMAYPKGDQLTARAAAATETPMIFSNQASAPMEECAREMGNHPRWFQLYWSQSDELVQSLVQRAEKTGAKAIVVTLDTTQLGWRPRDLKLAYLPFLRGMGIAQYTSDPVFQKMLDKGAGKALANAPQPRFNLTTLRNALAQKRNYPGSFWSNLFSDRATRAVRLFINIYARPDLSWEDLPKLRSYTSLPIVLKGIMHEDDAQKAKDLGMDGIIVSNHGGRQVDGAAAALTALPRITQRVGRDFPVMMDSGIRSGTDAMKALALGAKAVCIGRPYVYALGIGGQSGVEDLIRYYRAELELNMSLSSVRAVSDLDPHIFEPS